MNKEQEVMAQNAVEHFNHIMQRPDGAETVALDLAAKFMMCSALYKTFLEQIIAKLESEKLEPDTPPRKALDVLRALREAQPLFRPVLRKHCPWYVMRDDNL